MKKTALLIDGGWFSKGLGKILKLPNGWPNAAQVVKNAQAVLQVDEELFRIFYYDCEPFDREVKNPVDGSKVDYKLMPAYSARKQFFFDLGQTGFVALRRGELKARGWENTAPPTGRRCWPAARAGLRPLRRHPGTFIPISSRKAWTCGSVLMSPRSRSKNL